MRSDWRYPEDKAYESWWAQEIKPGLTRRQIIEELDKEPLTRPHQPFYEITRGMGQARPGRWTVSAEGTALPPPEKRRRQRLAIIGAVAAFATILTGTIAPVVFAARDPEQIKREERNRELAVGKALASVEALRATGSCAVELDAERKLAQHRVQNNLISKPDTASVVYQQVAAYAQASELAAEHSIPCTPTGSGRFSLKQYKVELADGTNVKLIPVDITRFDVSAACSSLATFHHERADMGDDIVEQQVLDKRIELQEGLAVAAGEVCSVQG
ncbi:MAG TPA: hypothetical protein VJ836_05120 [Candidatus Saccharimonadales bacterium]|nr:hypothetical protein [Candidatus Saccharimonadales bacterium]